MRKTIVLSSLALVLSWGVLLFATSRLESGMFESELQALIIFSLLGMLALAASFVFVSAVSRGRLLRFVARLGGGDACAAYWKIVLFGMAGATLVGLSIFEAWWTVPAMIAALIAFAGVLAGWVALCARWPKARFVLAVAACFGAGVFCSRHTVIFLVIVAVGAVGLGLIFGLTLIGAKFESSGLYTLAQEWKGRACPKLPCGGGGVGGG